MSCSIGWLEQPNLRSQPGVEEIAVCFRVGSGTGLVRTIDPRTVMWTRACGMIDRAERLHRQFFQPVTAPVHNLCWEPPVDITETDSEVLITVALPGVDRSAEKVTVDTDRVLVEGFRGPSAMPRGNLVHRLEIPYGKLGRQITLRAARHQHRAPAEKRVARSR
jgi:HSP20 family protein